mgnify:CR=1 FL=1
MNYLYIFFLSVGSAVALFILTKIIGNKQLSEMNMFDYVVGITIGSIAAEMATGIDGHAGYALLAMAVYAFWAFLLSVITAKSLKIRRFTSGKTVILMSGGKIYKQNLKKARMDLSEFLSQIRLLGYFDLNEVYMAFLEPNGKISVQPKSVFRPATPNDIGKNPPTEKILCNVVLDGEILYNNLKKCGISEKQLLSRLKAMGYPNIDGVLLACADNSGAFQAYGITDDAPDFDPFL